MMFNPSTPLITTDNPVISNLAFKSVDIGKKLANQRVSCIRKDPNKELSLKSILFVHILLAEEIVKTPALLISSIAGKVLYKANTKVGDLNKVKRSFHSNKAKGALHFALFAILQAANATKIVLDAAAILMVKAAVVAAVALPFVLIAIPLIFIPIPLIPMIGVGVIVSLPILLLAFKTTRIVREHLEKATTCPSCKTIAPLIKQADLNPTDRDEGYNQYFRTLTNHVDNCEQQLKKLYPKESKKCNLFLNKLQLSDSKQSIFGKIFKSIYKDMTCQVEKENFDRYTDKIISEDKELLKESPYTLYKRVIDQCKSADELKVANLHMARILLEQDYMNNDRKRHSERIALIYMLARSDKDLLTLYDNCTNNQFDFSPLLNEYLEKCVQISSTVSNENKINYVKQIGYYLNRLKKDDTLLAEVVVVHKEQTKDTHGCNLNFTTEDLKALENDRALKINDLSFEQVERLAIVTKYVLMIQKYKKIDNHAPYKGYSGAFKITYPGKEKSVNDLGTVLSVAKLVHTETNDVNEEQEVNRQDDLGLLKKYSYNNTYYLPYPLEMLHPDKMSIELLHQLKTKPALKVQLLDHVSEPLPF